MNSRRRVERILKNDFKNDRKKILRDLSLREQNILEYQAETLVYTEN